MECCAVGSAPSRPWMIPSPKKAAMREMQKVTASTMCQKVQRTAFPSRPKQDVNLASGKWLKDKKIPTGHWRYCRCRRSRNPRLVVIALQGTLRAFDISYAGPVCIEHAKVDPEQESSVISNPRIAQMDGNKPRLRCIFVCCEFAHTHRASEQLGSPVRDKCIQELSEL